MTPEQVELAVVIGNNFDKYQALNFMNEDQIKRVLEDLFSRTNPLFFYDSECHPKDLGIHEYLHNRKTNQVPNVEVKSFYLINKIIKLKKMPLKYGLTILKQIENLEDYDFKPWWRTVMGQWIIKNITKMPGVETYLCRQIIEQFNQKTCPDIFKENPKLFDKYQEEFLAKLKQSKNISQLQRSTTSLINIIGVEKTRQFLPILTGFLKEKISTLKTKDLLTFHKGEKYKSKYLMEEEDQISDLLIKIVAEELPKREHILKPDQNKLIRKMSIHAGKKLNLQEAQDLANRLKLKK